MRPRLSILLSILALACAAAWVQRGEPAPDLLAEPALRALLAAPTETNTAGKIERNGPPLWRALLAPPSSQRTAEGVTLRLARVLAFPTAAHLAAASAGELLELEASGPHGPLGAPLWKVILESPAVSEGEHGRTLRLYGCRHSSDPAAGPVLEDSYTARLSLAHALGARTAELGVELAGTEFPAKGGVNFEVVLLGDTQSVRVTFDGRPGLAYWAARAHRPVAPNDARARANLCAALRALAATDPALGTLTIAGESEPADGGLDLRLERYDEHLSLVAQGAGTRLSAACPMKRTSAQ